ncbi:hypothetical protein [Acrocarpospora macrocephala]|nr:hypothetical protein [Acrocarpospora macrocephala]
MTPDDFTTAAERLRAASTAHAPLLDGRRGTIVALFLCEETHHHFGPCPDCRILEARYSGTTRHLTRLLDARTPLADLFDTAAAFLTDYPALGRPHVDGEPCEDHACRIVTQLRDLARTINPPVTGQAGEQR